MSRHRTRSFLSALDQTARVEGKLKLSAALNQTARMGAKLPLNAALEQTLISII